ncbi:MAG: dienelactone hydrolase family protein [Ruthenibacterium sp.]|jgi:membrane protein|nr:hypothetical protein [Oscillospiraceae bacterium]
MTETKSKFSLDTAIGCKRVLAVLVSVAILLSFFAQLISTDMGRIKVEKIKIDARGATLEGELYYPVGTTDEDSYPAVVIVPGAGNINYQLRSFAEELAKRNYVVFNINAYGSGASETPVYNENDQGVLEYDIFATPMGCLDAVNFVRTLKFVDQENIGVMGHSQGSRRSGYAALMDCGYYTFNDIMLTVLHEDFGVDISEEDLLIDADVIANERLDASELKSYEVFKAQQEENYNTMIKGACLIGSTAQYVNPTAVVTVAGHEVTRNCQVNLCIINGTFDYSYVGFNTSDDVKNAWYIPSSDEVVQGAYYSVDDNNGTSQIIGTFREDTASANQELASAIQARTLRTVLLAKETHAKELVSSNTTAMVIDYFNQVLNADVSTAAIPSGMTFYYREFLNFFAMLAMLATLFPIIKLMTMTVKYKPCLAARQTIAPTHNVKMGNIIVIVGTIVLNGLAIYLTNAGKQIITFNSNGFFPLMITCWSPFYFLEWLALAGIILTIIYLLVTKCGNSFKTFVKENFTFGFKNIIKCLGISAVFIFVGYLLMAIVQYLFYQDFRIWQIQFSPLTADQWLIVVRYALLALPFMLITNITSNYLADVTSGNRRPNVDALINVAITVAGVWLLCGITHIVDYSAIMPGKSITSFMLTYGAIIYLPIMTFVSRKAYQITKNIWVGTFVSSILMAWMLVCASGTNGMYVAQTWISNFLG